MKPFTIGADPELFFFNPSEKKYISSIGLVGGSKTTPKPIGNGCAVQEDNVAVEFNIPICHNLSEFIEGLEYNLRYLEDEAQKLGLELAIDPSAKFTADQLAHPMALVFGCEPDYNAWTRSINPRPACDDPSLRSAGGHIHVGFSSTDYDFEQVVRAMDIFVGCEMVEFDKDVARRKLYGGPGAFRKKPYGIEYRTASNAWIKSKEKMEWAYNQTEKALGFVASGKNIPADGIGETIQACIWNSDVALLNDVRRWVNG